MLAATREGARHALQPFHERGLAVDELSPPALRTVRFIMLGIAGVIALALLPSADASSFWVHGLLHAGDPA